MNFSFIVSLYGEDSEKKKVFISSEFNPSGAKYNVEYGTAEDIGKALAEYLDNNYPEVVENPNYWEDLEEM